MLSHQRLSPAVFKELQLPFQSFHFVAWPPAPHQERTRRTEEAWEQHAGRLRMWRQVLSQPSRACSRRDAAGQGGRESGLRAQAGLGWGRVPQANAGALGKCLVLSELHSPSGMPDPVWPGFAGSAALCGHLVNDEGHPRWGAGEKGDLRKPPTGSNPLRLSLVFGGGAMPMGFLLSQPQPLARAPVCKGLQ